MSLVIWEMQIKMALRYYLTPIRMTKIEKKIPKIAYAGEDEE